MLLGASESVLHAFISTEKPGLSEDRCAQEQRPRRTEEEHRGAGTVREAARFPGVAKERERERAQLYHISQKNINNNNKLNLSRS